MEKAEVLAGLVIDHRPMLAVESGVFGGRSLFAIALAMKENGMGLVWGIDPWTVDAAIEGGVGKENEAWWTSNVNLEDIYKGFVSACCELGLLRECRWIRAKSDQVACIFEDESIDLLHCDSNHSELVSCREVQTWCGKIKPGGFWVVDDTDWTTQSKALTMIRELGFEPVTKAETFTVFRNGNT